jgi:2-keto-4-pentenoate hydratase/2-oxohepta-3-ene-1,7-dioic acid hydratase in catechol pathway/regulator of RNase E activity RraA
MGATKVIAIHGNYASRANEFGTPPPGFPSYFLKPPSTIAADGDPVARPAGCELLGSEAEVALIIGRTCSRVGSAEAWDYVSHVAPANDFGVYDLRYCDRGSNVRSKGWDGCTPIGPLVDARTVDPANIGLRSTVNGAVAQEASTADATFPLPELVADLSAFMTLEPGDVILTGTPAGSRPVNPGDVVTVELVGLSKVTSPITTSDRPAFRLAPPPKLSDADKRIAHGGTVPRPVTLTDEIRHQLNSVSTATLAGQLQRRGIRSAFMGGLRPTHPEMRMLGYARTLRYVPLREDLQAKYGGGQNAQRRAIEGIGPEEVLVIEARGEPHAATIGDIFTLRAMSRGAAGVVTDGALRDTPAIVDIELPVYYFSSHAATLGRMHMPLDIDGPVSCAGVFVEVGDIIVGDGEGAIVIPAALVEEVARDSYVQEEEESFAIERVRAGESTIGLFPLSRDRRPDYETWKASQPS